MHKSSPDMNILTLVVVLGVLATTLIQAFL
jgi:hypothetical protein